MSLLTSQKAYEIYTEHRSIQSNPTNLEDCIDKQNEAFQAILDEDRKFIESSLITKLPSCGKLDIDTIIRLISSVFHPQKETKTCNKLNNKIELRFQSIL